MKFGKHKTTATTLEKKTDSERNDLMSQLDQKSIVTKNPDLSGNTSELDIPKLLRSKTVLKEFEDPEEDLIVTKPASRCSKMSMGTKARYTCMLVVIAIISLIAFLLFAIIAYFNPMYDMFGPGILFSRGAALAIIVLTMIAMFLVTYDATTFCQNKLKKRCATFFDFQVLFHRFCGFLILFYSWVHTIGHLTGSIRGLSKEKDVNEINDVLTHHEFDEHLTYEQILFTTLPGVTGLILLFIITFMSITSTEKMRRKHFQLFAVVHTFCFPLFILLIVAHGSGTWLNYGFPLGAITVLLSLILYFIFWIRKLVYQYKGGFDIYHVEVSPNDTF